MDLAIDFGGTNIKTGVFRGGELTEFFSLPSFSGNGIESALERVRGALLERGITKSDVETAGIAMPGVVDPEKKRLMSVNNKFSDAVSFGFEQWFRANYGCSLIMENDANAALYGEIRRGCAVGERDAVLMTLGTGIGTAAMVGGRLLRGAHFQAGILGGHFIVDIGGRPCTCGGRGCLETLAGSRELERSIPLGGGYGESRLGREGVSDMKSLMDGVRNRDDFCNKVFDRIMDIYAAGVINLIHAYDPVTVILSGGVMGAGDLILPALMERVDRGAWTPWGRVSWKTAENPDRSVLLGLAARMDEEETGYEKAGDIRRQHFNGTSRERRL